MIDVVFDCSLIFFLLPGEARLAEMEAKLDNRHEPVPIKVEQDVPAIVQHVEDDPMAGMYENESLLDGVDSDDPDQFDDDEIPTRVNCQPTPAIDEDPMRVDRQPTPEIPKDPVQPNIEQQLENDEQADNAQPLPGGEHYTVDRFNVTYPPNTEYAFSRQVSVFTVLLNTWPIAIFISFFLGGRHLKTLLHNLNRDEPRMTLARLRELALMFVSYSIVSGYQFIPGDMSLETSQRMRTSFSIWSNNFKCKVTEGNRLCGVKAFSKFSFLMEHIMGFHVKTTWRCHVRKCPPRYGVFATRTALKRHLTDKRQKCYLNLKIEEIEQVIDEHLDNFRLRQLLVRLGIDVEVADENPENYLPLYTQAT